ncbi:MAG: hypothetical protein M1814_000219 [Vezdaea aestivalis]|nr:MAG: hypothetical protein M1814_000219 [Vezdaea aestivalis]
MAAELEAATWPELQRLATSHPESGIHFQESIILVRAEDVDVPSQCPWSSDCLGPDPWFKNVVLDFSIISNPDFAAAAYGQKFMSVCINPAIYLSWLASECVKKGAVLQRGDLKHISEAALLHKTGDRASLVVNCTGLGAVKLQGILDESMYPIRGQTVLVSNHPGRMFAVLGTEDRTEELCYIMERALGGGTILGGSYQIGNWDSEPDMELAMRIMERATEVCPDLTNGHGSEALRVIRHGVGLRPARKDGIRIQRETIEGIPIVHNYGHGGYGYQTSWGCARRVLKEALNREQ